MNKAGKPLRFLGAVLGGWVALRLGAVALLPLWEMEEPLVASSDQPSRQLLTPRAAGSPFGSGSQGEPGARGVPAYRPQPPLSPPASAQIVPSAVQAGGLLPPRTAAPPPDLALSGSTEPPSSHAPLASSASASLAPATRTDSPASSAVHSSPWSFTAWALWRRDGASGLAQAPLLGGSQGGVRLDYRIWTAGSRSISLYGRVTRALERPTAEQVALGISLRPVEAVPISLLIERRQKLGRGSGSGFAFMAAGGIGPKEISRRVELEGYAQGGVVTLPGSTGFADGRFSLAYRLTRRESGPGLAIGVALSGSTQTGVSRLDVGPEVRLRLPVAKGRLRLSAEWRERIAGAARPSSGPALGLVADF